VAEECVKPTELFATVNLVLGEESHAKELKQSMYLGHTEGDGLTCEQGKRINRSFSITWRRKSSRIRG
jgi:hypothetical protein